MKKTNEDKKHINKYFTGLSWDLGGDLFMCFSPQQGITLPKHRNRFLPPTQSRRNPAKFMYVYGRWTQKPFAAEPLRNDSGTTFRENDSGFGRKVRVAAEKSELQAESQRYSRADPQNPNRIAQKRWLNRVWVLLQKPSP